MNNYFCYYYYSYCFYYYMNEENKENLWTICSFVCAIVNTGLRLVEHVTHGDG